MQDKEVAPSESKDTALEEACIEAYIDEYWSAFRRHVHALLAWGYEDSRHRVQAKQQEPDITGFIAEAIKDRLNDPVSPDWCMNFWVDDDPPIPGGGRTGRGRWRPDLIFVLMGRVPRLLYHFEAKRLHAQRSKNKNLEEYLGEEGLGCFLSGKYAGESDEAGMLGYVQCDDTNIWAARLRSAIDQDSQNKNELLLLPPQRNIQIIDAFPQEWISKHGRKIGRNIVIHHILLEYI